MPHTKDMAKYSKADWQYKKIYKEQGKLNQSDPKRVKKLDSSYVAKDRMRWQDQAWGYGSLKNIPYHKMNKVGREADKNSPWLKGIHPRESYNKKSEAVKRRTK